jgi:hypothetical protein
MVCDRRRGCGLVPVAAFDTFHMYTNSRVVTVTAPAARQCASAGRLRPAGQPEQALLSWKNVA